MATIITADIDLIGINPYRRLHAFPYIESKLEALERSIKDVGLWPSVIAREDRGSKLWRYEQAFGHHRIEAARRLGIKQVPLIIEPLSDRRMLEYMGRENLEDYNASFLIQLEAWEAAVKSSFVKEYNHHHIEIAKLLGWTRVNVNDSVVMNATASACHAAYALIDSGHMAREHFAELTVEAARNIAERAWSRVEQIEKVSKERATPRHDIEVAKRHVGRAAADTAKQVRQGKIQHRDIRATVDFKSFERAKNRPSPLFSVFANAVADSLKRTINTDADADKMRQIEEKLPLISMLEDWQSLRRLQVELVNLGERAERWNRRLTPTKEKVVHFRALENKGA